MRCLANMLKAVLAACGSASLTAKTAALSLMILCASPPVFAQQQGRVTETPPPFKTATGVSKFLQKYTGLTWLSNRVASATTSTVLSIATRSPVSAKIRSYSLTDMLQGEFKSVDVKVRGGKFRGMPLGKIHAASQNPFKLRLFSGKRGSAGVSAPTLVAVEGDMAAEDITRALNSKRVASQLRFLKLDLPGLGEQRLQVVEPKVTIEGDRVKVKSWLITAGAPKTTGIDLQVTATPALEGGRFIMLKNMDVQSADIQNPAAFSQFAEDLLNPLVDFGRMDRMTHAIRFDQFEIQGRNVHYKGRLLLAPKPISAPKP